VTLVGEPIVAALETAADVFRAVLSEGIPGLWRFIQDQLADLKSMVLDAIFDYIKERVLVAGITWIIGLLNPVSAFFKACKAIYDIVVFFVERGSQIAALVDAIIKSVSAIAKGSLGAAAQWIEDALAKTIPVAIGFLASLLGLGNIGSTIRSTIEKAQKPINKAIDWTINLAVKGVKAAGKLVAGVFGKKEDDRKQKLPETADPGHDARVTAGLASIDELELQAAPGGRPTLDEAQAIAHRVRENHPVFQSIAVIDGGDHWIYRWVGSKGDKTGHSPDPEVKALITRLKKIPVNKGVGKLIKVLSRPLTENMRKGYVFQADRTIYWDDEGLLLRIEYTVDNPSTAEVSVFDIVINDPEGARDENGRKIRLFVDTKNWEKTSELLAKLEQLQADKPDDPEAWERLEIQVQQRIKGLATRLKKYRRTGLNIVIEWRGEVPGRIEALKAKRRGKLGSVRFVSIADEVE
jgi:hypothetical protein